MCIAPVACSLSVHATLLHTHASTHNWIKSLGWKMRGKDMPASTDALQTVSGGSFSPFLWNQWGFCPLLSLYVWHANALPFWQLLFITSMGVRGPRASGTWAEGLNQPGVALRLSIGFMTSPCLLAVVWWPVMQWIQHLLLILSLMCWAGKAVIQEWTSP